MQKYFLSNDITSELFGNSGQLANNRILSLANYTQKTVTNKGRDSGYLSIFLFVDSCLAKGFTGKK